MKDAVFVHRHDVDLFFEKLNRLEVTTDIVHVTTDFEGWIVSDFTKSDSCFFLLANKELTDGLNTIKNTFVGVGCKSDAIFLNAEFVGFVFLIRSINLT